MTSVEIMGGVCDVPITVQPEVEFENEVSSLLGRSVERFEKEGHLLTQLTIA